ncbi:MAG: hypothetical protein ACRDI0_11815 [Actinomycetota bacterium]
MIGLGAAAVVTGTAVWYARTILDQGDGLTSPRPFFVLASLAGVFVLLVAGSVYGARPPSGLLLAIASGALLMLGLIGLFSIGIFLLLAGILASLATVAAVRRGGGRAPIAVLGAAGSVALVLGWFVAVAAAD